MSDSHEKHTPSCRSSARPGWGWVLVGLAVIASVLLWQDHRTHMLAFLPYLILFACPLMHLLHRHGQRHQGHGGHGRP
jgi:hypothetical protein